MEISKTPAAPYYAVIFTSLRTQGENGYEEMGERMVELAKQQPGYLGHESVRDGLGITVSYWENLEAIQHWKRNTEHLFAQKQGKALWYDSYKIRICKVEREYGFERE